MMQKELKMKVSGIIQTIGMEWDSIAGKGRQSKLGNW
jgi:hypothetical protein